MKFWRGEKDEGKRKEVRGRCDNTGGNALRNGANGGNIPAAAVNVNNGK